MKKGSVFNLDSAVEEDKSTQSFESESLLMRGDHSQKVKAPLIKSDYGSKDCVDLSSSTAESRFKEVSAKIRLDVREKPSEKPYIYQDWRDLLFLHWQCDKNEIQKTLPPGLYVDTFEGNAFITIASFSMTKLKLLCLPQIPGLKKFFEVNLRTYVYDKNGIPGVWFYSLDIDSVIFSNLGKYFFSLPYFYSDLSQEIRDNEIIFKGNRYENQSPSMEFSYRFDKKNIFLAKDETLDFFLIERYVFFFFDSKKVNPVWVHHRPYPLNEVKLLQCEHTFWKTSPFHFLKNSPDYVHCSPGIDVAVYPFKKKL